MLGEKIIKNPMLFVVSVGLLVAASDKHYGIDFVVRKNTCAWKWLEKLILSY